MKSTIVSGSVAAAAAVALALAGATPAAAKHKHHHHHKAEKHKCNAKNGCAAKKADEKGGDMKAPEGK